MNQELKNLKLTMNGFKENMRIKNFGASKSILFIYERMLNQINSKDKKEKDKFKSQMFDLFNSEYEDIKTLHTEVVNSSIPFSIIGNEFRALKNLQGISETLSYLENMYSDILKSFSVLFKIDTKRAEDMLDESLKNKSPIVIFDEDERGIGKTVALAKKANELNCVLVVATHNNWKYVNEIKEDFGFSFVSVCSSLNLRTSDKDIENKDFLVDEMVSDEMIKNMIDMRYNLIGGFKRVII